MVLLIEVRIDKDEQLTIEDIIRTLNDNFIRTLSDNLLNATHEVVDAETESEALGNFTVDTMQVTVKEG